MYTRPLLWFRFRDRLGRGWRVLLSTPDLSPDLGTLAGGCEGYTNYQTRCLCIDARYPWERIVPVLFHEMGHVAAYERESISPKLEETAVRMVTGPLLGIVTAPPFNMKVPRRPAGFARFQRWALEVDPLDD